MPTQQKHKPSCKVWIEYKGTPVLGKGGADILQTIDEENSLTKAAISLGMSYRYLWNYIQKTQKTLQAPIIETFKGGKAGGGGAKLTALGKSLLEEYRRVERHLGDALSDKEWLDMVRLRISSPNKLEGKVVSIEKDEITAKVKIEIRLPAIVTAVITKEAVEALGIKVGDGVHAIVKSTEVIVGK